MNRNKKAAPLEKWPLLPEQVEKEAKSLTRCRKLSASLSSLGRVESNPTGSL